MCHQSDLTGDGGVLKQIIKEANADAIGPKENLPFVDVCYVCTHAETGEVLYTTRREENSTGMLSFDIGRHIVIRGLEIAIKSMKVGERAMITCKPNYAFGGLNSPFLPTKADVVIDVELVACWSREIGMQRELARPASDDDAAAGEERWRKIHEKRLKEKMRKWEEEVVNGEYDLTGDGGVVKKIIRKAKAATAIGPTYELPFLVVCTNGFVVKLENGEVYDCTQGETTSLEDDTNLEVDQFRSFRLGSGIVMEGWEIALLTMRVGDIATITCKPDYACGDEGCWSGIPPGATVIATLKLGDCRSCEEGAKSPEDLEKLHLLQTEEAVVAFFAAWNLSTTAAADDDDTTGAAAAAAFAAAWMEPKEASAAAAAVFAAAWKAAKAAADDDADAIAFAAAAFAAVWKYPEVVDADVDATSAAAAAAAAAAVAWKYAKAATARVQVKLDAKKQ